MLRHLDVVRVNLDVRRRLSMFPIIMLKSVAWRILLGASAGAIAGCLIGGIGGRLAMLLLRFTSPPYVIGMISDDGFQIGVVTINTFNLLLGATLVGECVGVIYVTIRDAIPSRMRVTLWTLLSALCGGSVFVHDDGIDFRVLKPALLAIVLFIGLPGAAGMVMAWLVERWSTIKPWESRRLTFGLVLASLVGTVAVVFAFAVGILTFVLSASVQRVGWAGRLAQRAGRIVVPFVLGGLAIGAASDLTQKSLRILN